MKGFLNKKYRNVVAALALIIVCSAGRGKLQDGFPTPAGNPNQLFYLQRTPNTNTIVCELNYKDGALDPDEPVRTYWIRYTEQGQRAELSYIQRKFAYGVKAKALGGDKYELRFAGYKKYVMNMRRGHDVKYHVYANINNKEIILHRIFVKINGGSMFSPNVEYVELKGTIEATGEQVTERMKI